MPAKTASPPHGVGPGTDPVPESASSLAREWTGVLAGPTAFGIYHTVSYAIVKWTCGNGHMVVLHLLTVAALAATAGGAYASWSVLQETAENAVEDGGRPRDRARFMAMFGLVMCALFATTMVGTEVPRWILRVCQ
jgi:hypothetical protein